jgi:peptide/nickel transport system permease protein
VSTKETPPEILSAGAGLGQSIAIESHGAVGEGIEPVRARGYWEQVFIRFRRDKAAIASGLFVLFLVFAAFAGGPIASHVLGHGPNDPFFALGADRPVGPWTHALNIDGSETTLVLGGDDNTLQRDEFLRLLYGAQASLEVAFGAMVIGMVIGVLMGAVAGYFGGWIDTIISRLTEIVMAFPYLLFVIALASTVGPHLDKITLGFLGEGVLTLILVIGFFSWFYPARIVRAQVLSLREKEFVEAARMVGASDWRIIRSHLLPHLVAPIIVYSTIVIAQNILAEAGLSFLGLGIKTPTASWGNLLQKGAEFYLNQPLLMLWPGLAVLFATLAFNLLGDGLRDAFDPRSSR